MNTMKVTANVICLVLGLLVATTLARAEDMASMISQYRRAHGLSAVKPDAQLTAVAERQARAMAKAGVMDHNVAGPFAARVAGMPVGGAGENIAEGTKTWAETLGRWQASPGHNENLLLPGATHVGVAVAYGDHNEPFRAMVIARKVNLQAARKAGELPVLDGFPH
ncbi:MAG TPA: CAP domain-containing protein [Xanthobacteraceae bacterium]